MATVAVHCPGSNGPGAAGAVSASSSLNWSGYLAVASRHAVQCVEGSWVQPRVVCSKKGFAAAAIWVGIDGAGGLLPSHRNITLAQLGTEAECSGGVARYYAWTEVFPQQAERPASLAVRPGDRISVVVRPDSTGGVRFQLANLTLGTIVSKTSAISSAPLLRQEADWVVEAITAGSGAGRGRLQPLANFGSVVVHGAATIAGALTSIGGAGASVARFVISSQTGVAKDSVSALDRTGSSFTVRWRHR